jgi:hypothetical protein
MNGMQNFATQNLFHGEAECEVAKKLRWSIFMQGTFGKTFKLFFFREVERTKTFPVKTSAKTAVKLTVTVSH